jgi:ketosteroid isomerase-like protein
MFATQKGDIETVLNLMADDVIFMVAGQKPFGKEAFAAASRGMMNVRFEGTKRHRGVEGPTITPGQGVPVHRAGYTLTILRKQEDGRWVLACDANLVTMVAP